MRQIDGSLDAKIGWILPASYCIVSIQYRLVTDGRTDGHTRDDSIYRASVASCGRNDYDGRRTYVLRMANTDRHISLHVYNGFEEVSWRGPWGQGTGRGPL